MTQAVIKQTHQETVVKVWGASGTSETISLAGLVGSNQVVDESTSQKVTITGISWTGGNNGIATVSRNDVTISTLQANAAGMLYFDGQTMPPDNVESLSDIVVDITGAACEVWLKLRKVSGYKSKSGEYGQYGSYEDETRVGGSTTVNGSPDYVAP